MMMSKHHHLLSPPRVSDTPFLFNESPSIKRFSFLDLIDHNTDSDDDVQTSPSVVSSRVSDTPFLSNESPSVKRLSFLDLTDHNSDSDNDVQTSSSVVSSRVSDTPAVLTSESIDNDGWHTVTSKKSKPVSTSADNLEPSFLGDTISNNNLTPASAISTEFTEPSFLGDTISNNNLTPASAISTEFTEPSFLGDTISNDNLVSESATSTEFTEPSFLGDIIPNPTDITLEPSEVATSIEDSVVFLDEETKEIEQSSEKDQEEEEEEEDEEEEEEEEKDEEEEEEEEKEEDEEEKVQKAPKSESAKLRKLKKNQLKFESKLKQAKELIGNSPFSGKLADGRLKLYIKAKNCKGLELSNLRESQQDLLLKLLGLKGVLTLEPSVEKVPFFKVYGDELETFRQSLPPRERCQISKEGCVWLCDKSEWADKFIYLLEKVGIDTDGIEVETYIHERKTEKSSAVSVLSGKYEMVASGAHNELKDFLDQVVEELQSTPHPLDKPPTFFLTGVTENMREELKSRKCAFRPMNDDKVQMFACHKHEWETLRPKLLARAAKKTPVRTTSTVECVMQKITTTNKTQPKKVLRDPLPVVELTCEAKVAVDAYVAPVAPVVKESKWDGKKVFATETKESVGKTSEPKKVVLKSELLARQVDVPQKEISEKLKISPNVQALIDFHNRLMGSTGSYDLTVDKESLTETTGLKGPMAFLKNSLSVAAVNKHVPMNWDIMESSVRFHFDIKMFLTDMYTGNKVLIIDRLTGKDGEQMGTSVRLPTGLMGFDTIDMSVKGDIVKSVARLMGEEIYKPTFCISRDAKSQIIYFSSTELDGKLTPKSDLSDKFARDTTLLN